MSPDAFTVTDDTTIGELAEWLRSKPDVIRLTLRQERAGALHAFNVAVEVGCGAEATTAVALRFNLATAIERAIDIARESFSA